jgi:hypothetical protein
MAEALKTEIATFKTELLPYLNTLLPKWPVPPLSTHFERLFTHIATSSDGIAGSFAATLFLEATGQTPQSPEAKPAIAIAWVVELVIQALALLDDVVHQTKVRSGLQCWYLIDNHGYGTLSDAYLIENLAPVLFDRYTSSFSPDTIRALKSLIHEAILLTSAGEFGQSVTKVQGIQAWNELVSTKIAPVLVWLPFSVGLYGSQKLPAEIWRAEAARAPLVDVAKILQCRYDLAHLSETELRSWAFATAFEEGSPEQKAALAAEGSHAAVYEQLKVAEKGEKFQRDLIAGLPGKFAKVEPPIPEGIVNAILRFVAP